MKILISYRGIPQSPGWATGDLVANAFLSLGHEVACYGNYYGTNKYIEHRPNGLKEDWDLFLFLECGDGEPTYNELKYVRARKRASWFFDSQLYIKKWQSIVHYFNFDVNFIANPNLIHDVPNGHFLPYAADNLYIRNNTNKVFDFLIIGSDRPNRRDLYNQLKAACSGAVVGYKTGIFRQEYIDIISSSKYVVNDIAGGGLGLLPIRVFETLASGSELITPHNDGCSNLGLPCFEYKSIDDLITICIGLVRNPIFKNDQKIILNSHMYKNRCEKILECLK